MMRRTVDVLLAGAALIALAPLLLLIALLIWIREGRPVLFIQRRAGVGGVPFCMFKFRTMRVDAPDRPQPGELPGVAVGPPGRSAITYSRGMRPSPTLRSSGLGVSCTETRELGDAGPVG